MAQGKTFGGYLNWWSTQTNCEIILSDKPYEIILSDKPYEIILRDKPYEIILSDKRYEIILRDKTYEIILSDYGIIASHYISTCVDSVGI